ncbi:hypothetical protein CRUP_019550 [Coryphaenoides rupestris]|nr:hypothetical protein CRUP_019550 [Coryphaenoides rupestris]
MPTTFSTPEANSTASSGVIGQILNHIPLPHWAVYTILGAGGFVVLLIICCCIHCYCKRKSNKKKRKKMDPDGLKEKSSANLVGSGGDAQYGSTQKTRGKLLYSMEYIVAKTELTVGIKQAAELLAMDLGGLSDPYVKVYICPSKTKTCETKVHRNTLNPVFNQLFSFPVKKSVLAKSEVVMQVFDFNRFTKHRIIGELRMDLSSMDWNHVIEEWQDLSEPLHGGALDGHHPGGQEPEEHGCQRKLRPVREDPAGAGQEEVEEEEDVHQEEHAGPRLDLVVSVWDHDAVTRNDTMGKIFLGSDASGNQLLHWADMLSNPRRPVSQWHTLLTAQQVNSTLVLKKKKIIPKYH